MRAYPLYTFNGELFTDCKSSMILHGFKNEENNIKYEFNNISNYSNFQLSNLDRYLESINNMKLNKNEVSINNYTPDFKQSDHYIKILISTNHKNVLNYYFDELKNYLNVLDKIILIIITPDSINSNKATFYLLLNE